MIVTVAHEVPQAAYAAVQGLGVVARAEKMVLEGRDPPPGMIRHLVANDLPRRWDLYEEGHRYGEFVGTMDEAKAEARSNCDPANYGDTSETMWIDWEIRCSLTDEEEAGTVECEPAEPDCEPGHSHDWQSPYSVLGGLKENPGVWGNGGGVIYKKVCCHCGKYRETDTWAQRPDTGEQGLTSVRYEDADTDSLEWLREQAYAQCIAALESDPAVVSYEDMGESDERSPADEIEIAPGTDPVQWAERFSTARIEMRAYSTGSPDYAPTGKCFATYVA